MMMMMMMMTGRGARTVPGPALSSVLLSPRSVSSFLSLSYDYTHVELLATLRTGYTRSHLNGYIFQFFVVIGELEIGLLGLLSVRVLSNQQCPRTEVNW